jgi:hypothetical protein
VLVRIPISTFAIFPSDNIFRYRTESEEWRLVSTGIWAFIGYAFVPHCLPPPTLSSMAPEEARTWLWTFNNCTFWGNAQMNRRERINRGSLERPNVLLWVNCQARTSDKPEQIRKKLHYFSPFTNFDSKTSIKCSRISHYLYSTVLTNWSGSSVGFAGTFVGSAAWWSSWTRLQWPFKQAPSNSRHTLHLARKLPTRFLIHTSRNFLPFLLGRGE